jgi:mRNA-degrading endonuclease toxin of MazEF toxin-antitoxin module
VKRGEIYRTSEKIPERGHKPGFYVIVSRDFIAENEDVDTVVCAPMYTECLGIRSEVAVGLADGLPRECGIRCDFLTLMFKEKLTLFVTTLSMQKQSEVDRALLYALQLVGT